MVANTFTSMSNSFCKNFQANQLSIVKLVHSDSSNYSVQFGRMLMEEKLRSGTTLVVDRYSYSGVAFSSAKGLDTEWCKVTSSPQHCYLVSQISFSNEIFYRRLPRQGCQLQIWLYTLTYHLRQFSLSSLDFLSNLWSCQICSFVIQDKALLFHFIFLVVCQLPISLLVKYIFIFISHFLI